MGRTDQREIRTAFEHGVKGRAGALASQGFGRMAVAGGVDPRDVIVVGPGAERRQDGRTPHAALAARAAMASANATVLRALSTCRCSTSLPSTTTTPSFFAEAAS